MGILSKLKGEFVDIIEWLQDNKDTLVYRFERYQNEIKMGAKLTVREGQVAAFVNEGKLADIYQPGMYTLQTQNMPVLSTLKGWVHGFNSPFKAEVYFVNTRLFTALKWGTQSPVLYKDPEFGEVQLRAFGSYEMKVGDPKKFLLNVVGTDGRYTTENISEQLRQDLVTEICDAIGESKIPVGEMMSNYKELGAKVGELIKPRIAESYGLDITKVLFQNISLPPEYDELFRKKAAMKMFGVKDYTQFQTANAIEKAAENPSGGTASVGVGMGAGFVMANQMGQSFTQNQAPMGAPPPLPQQSAYFVAVNGQQQGPFNMQALQQMIQANQLRRESLIWKQGMPQWTAAGQVGEVSGLFGAVPPPLPPK